MATEASTLVKEARTRAGLTQRQLAERAGVSQPVIAAYERGRRQPSWPMLEKLLEAAGFELQVLLRQRQAADDLEDRGRQLVQVLDLADVLPQRWKGPLRFPPLAG